MSEDLGEALESCKRLLSNSDPLLLDTMRQELSDIPVQQSMKLVENKVQYHDLKNRLRAENFKMLMHAKLAQCNFNLSDLTTTEDELDGVSEADVQSISMKLEELKERYDDSKDHLETLSDEIDSLNAEFEAIREQLSQKLKETEAKMSSLCEQHNLLPGALYQHQQGIRSQLDEVERDAALILEEEHHTAVELCELEASATQLKQTTSHELVLKEEATAQKANGSTTSLKWSTNCIRFLECMHCLENVGYDPQVWTVHGTDSTEQSRESLPLRVKIHLSWRGHSQPTLQGANVENTDFSAGNVIDKAVSINSVSFLLQGLKSLWKKTYPLVREINVLREKFAIDWEESERVLRVMCGKNAQVVCHLRVEPGYPGAGGVTLATLRGADASVEQSLQQSIPSPGMTLTEWVNFLNTTLSA